MKVLLIIICFNFCLVLHSQTVYKTGEIRDVRDGQIYSTIVINDMVWLTENMKYKTEESDSITLKDYGVELNGYYYPYQETDKVCPDEYRIPTISEWEEYVNILLELKKIPKTSIEYTKEVVNEKDTVTQFIIITDNFQFFDDPNPINLQETRQIQGTKMRGTGEINFWVRNGKSFDFKHHVHIYSNYIWNHSHKHHIDDKKKKKRKFVVRCIKSDA